MAERDERRGLLRGQDAGQPRGLQRIAFLDGAGADQPQRLARHRDRPARDRLAGGDRLVADVHHLHAPARVDVRQRRALPALPPVLPYPAYSSPSPCARKNDRLSSDTVRSTLFSFTSGGTCSAPGREVQHRLDAGGDDQVERRAARTAPARR